VRREAQEQIDKVREALREEEKVALEAASAAQSSVVSRNNLMAQIRTLQSSLRESQSQVEAGKVQVAQMMVQLRRLVMGGATPNGAAGGTPIRMPPSPGGSVVGPFSPR